MSSGTRSYRSPRREQQAAENRALVLAAATRLFSERGWAGSGMRDVAERAGVSVETVYAGFGSKPALLLAAIDAGVVGDTEGVPLAERPEFAALGVGGLDERIAATATLLTRINERTWGLRRALVEAAASEPQLAEKLRELERSRRANVRSGAERVAGRPLSDEVVDGVWALSGAEIFFLMTQVAGRSVQEYHAWLAGTLARLLEVTS
jgi:AcrR family transcriptional regulator